MTAKRDKPGEDDEAPLACATGKLRLYVEADLAPGTLELTPEQAHYLATVMRRQPGDAVFLFNGRDGEFSARLTEVTRKRVRLALEARTRAQDRVCDLWLLFAPVKRGRIDWLVEKAVELGVQRLVPVLTRRTMVARVNLERLTAHAVEAAEQCGRLSVPEIAVPIALECLLVTWNGSRKLLFCDERGSEGAAPPALDLLSAEAREAGRDRPWAILTGPEGGFDPAERAALLAHPAARAVSLGPRIMRADTAALAALALWQAVLGDWG